MDDLLEDMTFKLRTSRGCKNIFADGEETAATGVFFDNLTPPSNPKVLLDGHVGEIPNPLRRAQPENKKRG